MIDYIVEGDIYIANMTQHLTVESTRTPYDVFCSLRRDNPSPFGGYLNYGDLQIVSASPERFLQMRDGVVATTRSHQRRRCSDEKRTGRVR